MVAAAALSVGCGEPSVDVVALWVDGISNDRGNRPVRLYEAGERDQLIVWPDIPGSSVDLLQVGIDARARGIAISGTDSTTWVERGSGRRVRLSAAAIGREDEVMEGFTFTRSGDGLLRQLDVDVGPPTWIFAPLTGPLGLRTHALGPGREGAWRVVHAPDAPVLMFVEVDDDRVDGEVQAWAYPSEVGEGPVVDDLRPLARGTIIGAEVPGPEGVYLRGCAHGLCVAPSGRRAFTEAPSGCGLWSWSWVEAESTGADTPPQAIEIPCPGDRPTVLTAVLDDDLVVLDDGRRVYLVDLGLVDLGGPGRPELHGIPKPGGDLTPHRVAHGRTLMISSSAGEVLRVDASGPRMISGVQTPCFVRDGFAISPEGAWVIHSCNGQSGSDGVDGQIRRISVLGTELFAGIPMRPIAIDDDGNALLYSISSDDDGDPRGLFVLTGDGQLTRVDELEPFPAQVMRPGDDGDPTPGRFVAAGPS